jgi:gamma-glutamyltranspeptidase/glutathione hydrolase
VWECPPNGQGLAALLALQVAKQYPLTDYESLSADRYHLLVESMRLGFADAATYVADPEHAAIPLRELLSDDYARERAKLVSMERANLRPLPGSFTESAGSDTVYFCVVDAEGNGCSFINSNFQGFGTGIVPRGCGFSLQNRGRGFVLEKGHRNCLAPGKRPYHTIIPGMATNPDGSLFAVLGVMGGMMQPQGHLQVVTAMVDDDVDPQAALDRPRFYLDQGEPGGELLLEDAVPDAVALQLSARGHHVQSVSGSARSVFGLGTIIRPENGVWWAGCDPRGDGVALGLG